MGATNNLMDYAAPTATQLNKYQWDLIHDPENILFAWLEDEEEGEDKFISVQISENQTKVKEILDYIRNANLNPPRDYLINIYELGFYCGHSGKVDLGDGVKRNITVKIGMDAGDSKKIIINLNELLEPKYSINNQMFYYINEDRYDGMHGLEIICNKSDYTIVKNYIEGHTIEKPVKLETIVENKLIYNYTLSRYEDSNGNIIEINELIDILMNDCIIEGGMRAEIEFNEEIITLRNGEKPLREILDPIYDLPSLEGKILYGLMPAFGALIDLANYGSGSSPLTMIPYLGNVVEPLEYFAGWNDLDQDIEWAEAKIDYRSMYNFIQNYGNIYNVAFIYTEKDIFKELGKNRFVITKDFSPTNIPKIISLEDNPNLSFAYWGYLSEEGSIIIQGKLDYY
jgi:hypothetical protein